ncbi:MAG: ribosome maturation factor RimM [Hyphomicrobiaceae bacterium]
MAAPSESKLILLGRIAGAHGIRGEVVIHAYTDPPDNIAAYGPLADAGGTRTFKLQGVRVTAKGVIARIAGIEDRTAAEALRGIELYVDRDRLPAAAEGEYYHADLIGLAAVDRDGARLGEIVAVQNYGAGDLLEIRRIGSSRTELIPFTDDYAPQVDLNAGRVVIILPRTTDAKE